MYGLGLDGHLFLRVPLRLTSYSLLLLPPPPPPPPSSRTNVEHSQCNHQEECTQCINDWRTQSLKSLNPALNTNVANDCMPTACGNCNLQCYLCLRKVDVDTGTCRLHSLKTQQLENLNSTDVCSDAYSIGAKDWETIAVQNQSLTRTITCPAGSKQCLPSVLFKTSHVEYNEMYFQVELDTSQHTHDWIKTVDFTMRYRNSEFSKYEIGFRYGFLILNVLVWVLFECKMCERKKFMVGIKHSLQLCVDGFEMLMFFTAVFFFHLFMCVHVWLLVSRRPTNSTTTGAGAADARRSNRCTCHRPPLGSVCCKCR